MRVPVPITLAATPPLWKPYFPVSSTTISSRGCLMQTVESNTTMQVLEGYFVQAGDMIVIATHPRISVTYLRVAINQEFTSQVLAPLEALASDFEPLAA
jgi:hypothetical protein